MSIIQDPFILIGLLPSL